MGTTAIASTARPWRAWIDGRLPGNIPMFRNEKPQGWVNNTFPLPIKAALHLFGVVAPRVSVNEEWLEYGRHVLNLSEPDLGDWYAQAWWGHHATLACRNRLVTPGREHEVVALVEPVDWRLLESALAQGRGVILATPHWGVPKLASVLLAMRASPVMRLGFWRGYRHPIWDSNIRKDLAGYTNVYLQCFSHLRHGGIVAGSPEGKVGGLLVNPHEVEQILRSLPGVSDAWCRGRPHNVLGCVMTAQVVPSPGVDLEEAALRGACAQRMERYKVPQELRIVEQLSETLSGKTTFNPSHQ